MAGEFAQLLPFTWRGLHLPVSSIGISLAHDLVEHKYWGVDSARVEATGVAPVRISATIPISNSIVPGAKEKWQAGALYPDALRNFIIEFAKKTTGLVQHPEFGEIACKPERMEFEFTGERQDATEIRASWVETLDDEVVSRIVVSPVTEIELAVTDLNASGTDLKALVPQLPQFALGFEELLGFLTSLVDTVSVLQYRTVGIVNRILYQAHSLEVAIQRAGSGQLGQLTPLRPNALTWPAIQALQRMQAAAYAIRREALSTTGIGLYTVPALTTLAGVLQALPPSTATATLIRMNPNLVRSPVVFSGTIVRYPLPG